VSARVAQLYSRTGVAFAICFDARRDGWHRDLDISPSRIHPVAVSILWNDERGSCLFGMIDSGKGAGRVGKRSIPLSHWDCLPPSSAIGMPFSAVGGTVFSPLPLLGLCDLLDEGVEDTPASLR